MIHRLTALDRTKSVGVTLFDNQELIVQSDLLNGLVQALMLLGEEMGPVKGELREAELGQYQISILSKDHIAYIAIQDTYDSEPFTSRILENIIDKFHPIFIKANFHREMENEEEIKAEIKEMLQTMKFPDEKIDAVRVLLRNFQLRTNSVADTLFLADLDDGIVEIFDVPEDRTIVRILMEILSEIPFERHWIGQTKLRRPVFINDNTFENELWLIYRIGLTDFCLMGRAYYNSLAEQDGLRDSLEQLVDQISSLLIN